MSEVDSLQNGVLISLAYTAYGCFKFHIILKQGREAENNRDAFENLMAKQLK